jgi:hypothetical protein
MPMRGLTPPFVIPALVIAGVALTMVYGGPQEPGRLGYPVTVYLPKATYESLSREGGAISDIQARAARMVVQAAGN